MTETNHFNPQCICGGSVDCANADCERCRMQGELAALRSRLAAERQLKEAAEARAAGLEEAFGEIKEAAWAAHRDIGEWVQLACRQQQASADYTHDPLCATDAGLSRSQSVRDQLVGAIAKAAALLAPAAEEGVSNAK